MKVSSQNPKGQWPSPPPQAPSLLPPVMQSQRTTRTAGAEKGRALATGWQAAKEERQPKEGWVNNAKRSPNSDPPLTAVGPFWFPLPSIPSQALSNKSSPKQVATILSIGQSGAISHFYNPLKAPASSFLRVLMIFLPLLKTTFCVREHREEGLPDQLSFPGLPDIIQNLD